MSELYTRDRIYSRKNDIEVPWGGNTTTKIMNSWYIVSLHHPTGTGYIEFNLGVGHPLLRFVITPDWEHLVVYRSGKYYINRNGVLMGEFLESLFPDRLQLAIERFKLEFEPIEETAVIYTDYVEQNIKDVPTKHYKSRVAAGEIINSPMMKTKEHFSTPESLSVPISFSEPILNHHGGNIQTSITITRIVTPVVPVGDQAFIDNLRSTVLSLDRILPTNAVNSAYGNINQSKLAALVTLGESKTTIRHLALTFSRLLSIVRAIKTGKWKSLAPKTYAKFKRNKRLTIFELVEEAWWEARYAWRPLLIDAQNAHDLIVGKRSLTPRMTFRGQDESASSDALSYTTVIGGELCTVEATIAVNQKARAGVLCQANATLGLDDELGLTNLFDAAVELTPYSFIVQWFINLGGLLYALRPDGSFDIVASWLSVHRQVNLIGNVSWTNSNQELKSIPFQYEYSDYYRSPGATATLFSIDLKLDLFKITDLLSLARRLLL